MKNHLLALFLLLSGAPVLSSQAWNYDGHRIAVSFDGNSEPDHDYKWPTGDPDDWGAAAAGLAIVAKLGLQDKLVHCSYNNFINAPAGPDQENQLKISCEGAVQRWRFDSTAFFDITTHLAAAKQHLAQEMAKSTAEDPLYFLHAGLSEFLYQVVEEVIQQGKIEALSHVYLLSHSGFNEKEKRRKWHHNWEEVQQLSENRIQYKKIPDQNAKENPNNLWHSGKDFSVWYWMRDHKDANVRWMYERLLAHSGGDADISDAGMFYYLLVGDVNGSPSKFQHFIGEGIAR
ncbi:MAG: hypothetical protein KTR30_01135 [Saprospiraceae bacterium]|nr:hypothetical protein [Saprospiraceae bacterium]